MSVEELTESLELLLASIKHRPAREHMKTRGSIVV